MPVKFVKKNKFCHLQDLYNESDVEQKFLIRLLADIGFTDKQVKTKRDISELLVGRGRKKEKYKPDYMILIKKKPKLILDAKHPTNDQDITQFEYQLSSYCIETNKKFKNENPLSYYIISNGNTTSLYKWDEEEPIITLQFLDFEDKNPKYDTLKRLVEEIKQLKIISPPLKLVKLPVKDLKKLFIKCHNNIWKKEKSSPTKAFYEFSKIVFIKMKEDRKLVERIDSGERVTKDDMVFSVEWIERNESTEPNPFSNILFRKLREDLEEEIVKRKKKRIFVVGDELNLKPNTIKEIVRMLQEYDLHSIDEDLNGRMFETFLNATIRGKELGQFFTPRQVVKYMVNIADIHVSKDGISDILDGCCGSGGFLIEAMALMTNQVKQRNDLSGLEKDKIIKDVKNTHLFGVEANPEIASVARMNMYLHGDGGSNIYSTDCLDKEILIEEGENQERKRDTEQLKDLLIEQEKKFDIVLTNPPFSMKYSKYDENEKRILSSYEIGKLGDSIKSNILFVERYGDLLKESGQLITIIDDSLLNSINDRKYLKYLREKYIIKQIISLPFNTFKNAGTSTKTSILFLRKKSTPDEKQPDIFMSICNNIGHDDFGRETLERNNLGKIYEEYLKYEKTGKNVSLVIGNDINEVLTCPQQIFTVKAKDLKNRLDTFYYSPELRELEKRVDALLSKKERALFDKNHFDIVKTLSKEECDELKGKSFKYIEVGNVSGNGLIEDVQHDKFEKLPTRARKLVRKGDLIIAKSISCIGQNTIIPEYFDKQLVSTGFIVLRPKSAKDNFFDSYLLWTYLRQPYVRKQFYYKAATAVQPEVSEAIFMDEIHVPIHTDPDIVKGIIDQSKQVIPLTGGSLLTKIDEMVQGEDTLKIHGDFDEVIDAIVSESKKPNE